MGVISSEPARSTLVAVSRGVMLGRTAVPLLEVEVLYSTECVMGVVGVARRYGRRAGAAIG
jgi:hypothetical protein